MTTKNPAVKASPKVEHNFPDLGPRRMVLNARRFVTALGNTELILLAMMAIEAVAAA